MALFSPRLPHVLTRADLAHLLSSTYAREVAISEELAHERLDRALKRDGLPNRIYEAVSAALTLVQGSRTEDALIDALSKAVPKRIGKIQAAPPSASLSAVTVWINLELGEAPENLRATLETDKGRVLLDRGFQGLGKYLVDQLVP